MRLILIIALAGWLAAVIWRQQQQVAAKALFEHRELEPFALAALRSAKPHFDDPPLWVLIPTAAEMVRNKLGDPRISRPCR